MIPAIALTSVKTYFTNLYARFASIQLPAAEAK